MNDSLTGFYGILLIPDEETRQRASVLASRLAPEAAHRVAAHQVHLTLYQARFENLPLERVMRLLETMRMGFFGADDPGLDFHMNFVASYNKQYLFWNAQNTSRLALAHEASLSLAPFIKKSSGEELVDMNSLTDEERNIRNYGHSLIGDRFLPHITLAADAAGFKIEPLSQPFDSHASKFVLGRMGTWGRLEEVLPY